MLYLQDNSHLVFEDEIMSMHEANLSMRLSKRVRLSSNALFFAWNWVVNYDSKNDNSSVRQFESRLLCLSTESCEYLDLYVT